MQWLVRSEHLAVSPAQHVRFLVIEGGNVEDMLLVNNLGMDDK